MTFYSEPNPDFFIEMKNHPIVVLYFVLGLLILCGVFRLRSKSLLMVLPARDIQ